MNHDLYICMFNVCIYMYVYNVCIYKYLHEKSCHRYVYKKYIPFGQSILLRRIISDDTVFDERLKELEIVTTTQKGLNQKLRELRP